MRGEVATRRMQQAVQGIVPDDALPRNSTGEFSFFHRGFVKHSI